MSSTFVTTIAPSVYADLSAAAYADFWRNPNAILPSELPPDWTILPQYSPHDTTTGAAALAHLVIHNYLVLIPQRLYSCGGIHNALQTDPYCFDAGFAVTLAS